MNDYEERKPFQLRLEARVKNDLLIKAREKLGMSQADVARRLNMDNKKYGRYELMRQYPSEELKTKICTFFRKKGSFLLEEDVFPEELKEVKPKNKYVAAREVPLEDLIYLNGPEAKLLPQQTDGGIKEIESQDFAKKALNLLLHRLDRKYVRVIANRYGIEIPDSFYDEENYSTGSPMTCAEIAKKEGVSGKRIQQIETRAVKLMQQKLSMDIKAIKDLKSAVDEVLE